MLRRLALVLSAAFMLAIANPGEAQAPTAWPAPLRDWVDWVKHGHESASCPALVGQEASEGDDSNGKLCAWPGALAIAATDTGARFSGRWTVYAKSAVPLPGDADNWPQGVRVNGAAMPVVPDGQGRPAVWLEPGTHAIEGSIPWVRRPESIPVPIEIAWVSLSVDGAAIQAINREDASLWLGQAESAPQEADAIELQVYRHLADGIPAMLTTRIDFGISGEGREASFGKPLPEGYEPVALFGELNARLEADGTLKVQLRPGNYTLTLVARAQQPLVEAQRPPHAEPWPDQEIWSYAGDARLRLAQPRAEQPIDPAQAGVPAEWQALPAFLVEAEGMFALDERSRGLSTEDQNQLQLVRELWLDFDGGRYRARDQVTGTMVRDWRLDVAEPYRLLRATEHGEGVLVTRGQDTSRSGVELRNPTVNVAASASIEGGSGTLPVTGWQQTFDSVSTTLHLPPGYRLYAAVGADRADGAWFSRWNLLDVFVVAVATLLAGWLGGRVLGALTLGYLVLGYQEWDAPRAALFVAIVLALLVKLLPAAGALTRKLGIVRALSLFVLALVALSFAAGELRLALYPQLEQGSPLRGEYDYASSLGGSMVRDMVPQAQYKAPMAPPPPPAPMAEAEQKLESIEVTGSRVKRTDVETSQPVFTLSRGDSQKRSRAQRYANNTLIQSGSGEPDWRWGDVQLAWSGPVLASQTVRLVISPPWLTRLTRVLLVGLMAAMLFRLAQVVWPSVSVRGMRSAAGLALVMLAVGIAPVARAQSTPSDELLEELRNRVLEAPRCAPTCAQLASAEVIAEGDRVRVALEFHAAERVGVPLPGAEALLQTTSLTVDGADAGGVHRDAQGRSWILLSRGVHRVELGALAAEVDRIGLSFPLKPARVQFSGQGWEAGGVRDQRLLTDTLELTRLARKPGTAAAPGVAQQFPAFVRVRRQLELGLDWTVHTVVERIAPRDGAYSVRVPLIPGERLVSSEFKVVDGAAEVPLAADAGSVGFESQLDRSDSITLEAPPLAQRAEVWQVTVGPVWHVTPSGSPAVRAQGAPADSWVYEFDPLPGERVTLAVTRPEAVAGGTLALDSVTMTSAYGKRAVTHDLNLRLRSTQGGQHVISLPPGAEVLALVVDNETLNLRPQDGKLTLPVRPGAQSVSVRLRETDELGLVSRLPAIDLGLAASNVQLVLNLPEDRWLLASAGPRVGPAVLYWGELAVMALVAFALSRTRRTPLRFHDWLLLGIGFSTFSWLALVIVVLWLFALDARARDQSTISDGVFNLRQLGLLLLTFVAAVALVSSIPQGLLGTPDMHVTGNGSTANSLRWFQDRIEHALPEARAVSLPMWSYKVAMLAWALWLAVALVRWLRWAYASYATGGYWRNTPTAARAPAQAATAAASGTADTSPAGSDPPAEGPKPGTP